MFVNKNNALHERSGLFTNGQCEPSLFLLVSAEKLPRMTPMPAKRLFPYLLVCLSLLFAVLDPEPSRGLGFVWSSVYWFTHIGTGLLLAISISFAMSRYTWTAVSSPAVQVALAGLIASLFYAPVAIALESLLPVSPVAEVADDWLDHWELSGGWRALVAEWLQLLPSFMAAWMLINAFPLSQAVGRLQAPESAVQESASETNAAPDSIGPLSNFPNEALQTLVPAAIGQDIIAIEADLHYLQIRTSLGQASVLGSLNAAEAELGERGVRIHRSHWVATSHVRSVKKNAQGWFAELSDGSRLPISRRKVREVRERLGTGFSIT